MTSRAWQATAYGEPGEVLELVERELPEPGPGEVRIRTTAIALNFPDVLLCRGQYQVRPEPPFVPGVECCGVVTAVGAGVDAVAVGDRVVGSLIGVLAEEAVLPAGSVFPAPPALTDAEAAALTVGYQTAWVGLNRRAALQAGETVLVTAASGGVGSAAVQLAAAAGARVIAVVGSAAKGELARRLGADVVIDRSSDDIVERVKAETGGRGVEVVFDPVGGDTYAAAQKAIAFEGRLLVVGFAGGDIQQIPANIVLVKNFSVVGVHWGLYMSKNPAVTREAHAALTELAASGVVRPEVTEVPFAEVPEALDRLAAGVTVGRLVAVVEP
ncbi:NADPH:quinone oxidoreductase family protein [Protaetiibacter intestinalis]|uniref:NADPH:quinone oxidoreductase family protein n=1 Tax=Protaetiibacter intestinalis TaxID=2419774 RepID=A0A387B926_9MICO|nr:NADPH:quinone oxidoreductase family protein [Protaetiibacter intestinalis]AYF98268.1 NADPH:quinone oxidoreductase family protein [Protaetiibacter intestinalis]